MKFLRGSKSYCNSYAEIITNISKKIKKIKKKCLKKEKIKAVGIDTIRVNATYRQIKKLLTLKSCIKVARNEKHIKGKIKGTGIYFKIYNNRNIEFYNIFQHYKGINLENQEALFSLIKKMKIYEIDLSYDSKKDIVVALKHKNYVKDTIYYSSKKFKKVVKYNKKNKNKLKNRLYRVEFTIALNLNKNKENKNKSDKISKKSRFQNNRSTNKGLFLNNPKIEYESVYNFFDSDFKEYSEFKPKGYYFRN